MQFLQQQLYTEEQKNSFCTVCICCTLVLAVLGQNFFFFALNENKNSWRTSELLSSLFTFLHHSYILILISYHYHSIKSTIQFLFPFLSFLFIPLINIFCSCYD
ncbi:hypothetical protein BCR41DRAFT_197010 [Lobosporangium transversale]|uniref:Uncharacterized protein n=1 Tax=Lobosporangium transversale TaxID=64571 RepID=A0A1Y2GB09_9FUNG|nr:hypothetical protein BCR41DRAFT_197010 [Lobosporangium transversale]ORZ04607.1 hypothetical protein BCR41DRAFT_197010 [Lobosporangium transversale]|eukprot:XP_021876653.1 hypothetical protein BCR41DRAFT_197010 [Lobosporangium transversale]